MTGCKATGRGGGIYASLPASTAGSPLVFAPNLTLVNNNAGSDGGGAYVQVAAGTVELFSWTATSNNAGSSGGGVAVTAEGVFVNQSTFQSNIATGSGGGLFVNASRAAISSSALEDNGAGVYGAALALVNNNCTLSSTRVVGNVAHLLGPAIFSFDPNDGLPQVDPSCLVGNNTGGPCAVSPFATWPRSVSAAARLSAYVAASSSVTFSVKLVDGYGHMVCGPAAVDNYKASLVLSSGLSVTPSTYASSETPFALQYGSVALYSGAAFSGLNGNYSVVIAADGVPQVSNDTMSIGFVLESCSPACAAGACVGGPYQVTCTACTNHFHGRNCDVCYPGTVDRFFWG